MSATQTSGGLGVIDDKRGTHPVAVSAYPSGTWLAYSHAVSSDGRPVSTRESAADLESPRAVVTTGHPIPEAMRTPPP